MNAQRIARTLIIVFIWTCCACNNGSDKRKHRSRLASTPIIQFNYGDSYPHDITSFTEGLLVHEGVLYESTGATPEHPQTRSLFGVLDLTSGKIDVKVEIDGNKYFGEGITFLNGKFYQLTYRSRIGFVYDAITFDQVAKFSIPSKEGWGMTTDGTSLIMSDGSHVLTYINPDNLKVIKKIDVTEYGRIKKWLNELEFINGFIYANVWTTNMVVKIDPNNGKVVGKLDFTSLAQEAKSHYPGSLEMNGIAFDPITNNLFITGKFWPKIYQITLEEDAAQEADSKVD